MPQFFNAYGQQGYAVLIAFDFAGNSNDHVQALS